ncbi:MAG: hypothetical protein EAZ90_27630 [Oscillatoriales cyanobacterium]|nr:MAG: hypothetical protein EAZ94_29635 [Oscillatoriales cyanobacterium]TAE17877.1 MAG: hypothetical protein EAZ93_30585 [Oscillatoriales cyanobacterium]TAE36875.1 MAG: hypothetical protein EAZ90_27630 [Oscillatoriales cyanobacterium]TAE56239.1 MAG: hypothetical protein EAZ88_04575 [Oscillatoriales cyanobacterium]TAE63101.1 MAG: hypothetical protein EAZ86_29645 [Oscillatoriales cyanobacterium]
MFPSENRSLRKVIFSARYILQAFGSAPKSIAHSPFPDSEILQIKKPQTLAYQEFEDFQTRYDRTINYLFSTDKDC